MLRILSDLHFFDARTQVTDLRQLEPLLAGVETLVLNGDSCEMRRGAMSREVEAMRTFFRQRVREVVFVTGNHDPDISEAHEFLAADGRVWITHGDVCFDDLTPWSRHLPEIREHLKRYLAEEPAADYRQLSVRFRLARRVAREEFDLLDRTVRNWRVRVAWLWQTFFPPRQVVAMLRAWRDLPHLAVELARSQRPSAQVVVLGHVHLPRVWRGHGFPAIVNTGSFFRPLGGNLADVHEDRVEVRRIVRDGAQFKSGKLLATIPFLHSRPPAPERPRSP